MSVLEIARARVDPPPVLPVDYLSWSSLRLFMACPESWRRRYILKQTEPSSGKMVLGASAGAALAQHYGTQLETGEGLGREQLLDQFSDEWDERTSREEIDYERETPAALKDSGARALAIYHAAIAPAVTPVAVEREFELTWPGVQWALTGYFDLEDSDGDIRDYKVTTKRITPAAADGDLQATIYLAARRAEGNPAGRLWFDTLLRQAQPKAETVETARSDLQLDLLTDRIFAIAAEINWRCQTDIWSGSAPGTWFCSTCRYDDCPLRLGRI